MKERNDLTPEAGLNTIHSTLSQAHSAMYLAGTTSILLLWGAIAAVGYLGMYGISNYASDFATDNPWFPAPLWGIIVTIGVVVSAIIGSRASSELSDSQIARETGLKVFAFWVVVTASAFLVPGLSGLWTEGANGQHIAGIAIGIISLGYVLFGLVSRPVLSLLGIGIAVAYYIPYHYAGDSAYLITAITILVLTAVCGLWLRRTGIR